MDAFFKKKNVMSIYFLLSKPTICQDTCNNQYVTDWSYIFQVGHKESQTQGKSETNGSALCTPPHRRTFAHYAKYLKTILNPHQKKTSTIYFYQVAAMVSGMY